MTNHAANFIGGSSRAEVWLKAATYLESCSNWKALNLILEVTDATKSPTSATEIEKTVDQFLIEHNAQPLQTVAETIFPASEYVHWGPEGVYERYPEVTYPQVKEQWGTYAYRLLRRLDQNGKEFRPLEECVSKMKNAIQRSSTSANYELNVFDSGFDLRTHDGRNRVDRNSPLGLPCLSHVSMKVDDGKLFLAALYRYHYYVERALGNLRGLAQLQRFVCDETGLRPGSLVCVSTLAKLDYSSLSAEKRSWNKTSITGLLEELNNMSSFDA